MHKLEFELKQHTPIIHFQARDIGATLRASEVKPKLDRFILTEIGKKHAQDPTLSKTDPYERGIEYFKKEDDKARKRHEKTNERLELYLIPGQEGALNYKLSFRLEKNDQPEYSLCLVQNPQKENLKKLKSIAKRNLSIDLKVFYQTAYFANEDKVKLTEGNEPDWSKIRLGLFDKGKIIGKTLCNHEGLLDQLSEHIEAFFLLHNFGSRQTKGFGSYTVKKILISDQSCKLKNVSLKYNTLKGLKTFFKGKAFLIRPENNSPVSSLSLLKTISSIHNKLRNNFLKKRFENNERKIEKDFVKQVAEGVHLNEEERGHYRFVRALLGLPRQFEFPDNEPPKSKRVVVQHIESDPDKVTIDRFASPLLYKPIDERIFVIMYDIPKELLGAKFSFKTLEENDQDGQILSIPNKISLKGLLSNNQGYFEIL